MKRSGRLALLDALAQQPRAAEGRLHLDVQRPAQSRWPDRSRRRAGSRRKRSRRSRARRWPPRPARTSERRCTAGMHGHGSRGSSWSSGGVILALRSCRGCQRAGTECHDADMPQPRRLRPAWCSPAAARCASAARRRRRCCTAARCCCGRHGGSQRSCAVGRRQRPPGNRGRALAHAAGLPVLHDAPGDAAGPLAGVKAGLHMGARTRARALAVSPCDAPLLPEDLFARLIAAAGGRRHGRDRRRRAAAVRGVAGERAGARERGARGRRASADLAHAGGHRCAGACASTDAAAFANLNTRADLAAVAGRLGARRADAARYQRYSCATNPCGKVSACGGSSTNPCVPASARKSPEPLGGRGTASAGPRRRSVTATGRK